ncbi:MAG: hypothetical protein JW726_07615 [Anaerolineales bacterium]|nr:hypothetical protein [Anaerolineales bacterium]
MKKHSIRLLIAVLLLSLLLAGGALAMTSDNYRLDWFTPLTGGGGGAASSEHYSANLTVGQTSISASASENYQARLGYWQGLLFYRVRLPLVARGY